MGNAPRRKFLQRLSLLSASTLIGGLAPRTWAADLDTALTNAQSLSADQLASEEDFWYFIQQSFTVSSGLINLNNGGVSPAPRSVQEAMKRYYDYSNEAPTYYMWRILDQGREPLRKRLAELAGCSKEEIAINRNSSEGLETVIFGLTLEKGDEIVAARQDYPNMVNAYKQR
ncbi:MAG: aminotransferase class V-fold PLP-dependent enzyme, partial [Bacteroidota bacterium]